MKKRPRSCEPAKLPPRFRRAAPRACGIWRTPIDMPIPPKRMFALIEVENTACSSWGIRDLRVFLESAFDRVGAVRLLQTHVNVAAPSKGEL